MAVAHLGGASQMQYLLLSQAIGDNVRPERLPQFSTPALSDMITFVLSPA
jgi:hypothetical protein